jgi:hypothetical protein
MNARKIWGFAVAVFVSVLSSGCGAVTAGAPVGVVASGGGGIVAASSAPAYRPAVIPEDVRSYRMDRGSTLIARRSLHR